MTADPVNSSDEADDDFDILCNEDCPDDCTADHRGEE